MKRHYPQRGIITLLTLMLMAVITSIAVAASMLMVGELRQTVTIGQGIVASYAAEAGMEDGLYTLKSDRDEGKTLAIASADQNDSQILSNSSWDRSAEPETTFAVTRLERDQTATLDYYDPDGLTGGGIDNIKVMWGDTCRGFAWLETTMSDFTLPLSMPTVHKLAQACVCDPLKNYIGGANRCNDANWMNVRCTDLPISAIDGANILSDHNYRFSFRLLTPQTSPADCTIENLSVTGYLGGTPVDIPAHLVITSTGSFGNTKQAITASVPWKAPVSGLASFVLFSEEDIAK